MGGCCWCKGGDELSPNSNFPAETNKSCAKISENFIWVCILVRAVTITGICTLLHSDPWRHFHCVLAGDGSYRLVSWDLAVGDWDIWTVAPGQLLSRSQPVGKNNHPCKLEMLFEISTILWARWYTLWHKVVSCLLCYNVCFVSDSSHFSEIHTYNL